jgi:GWxTD domain-containing protein
MTALEQFAATPAAQALTGALFHFVWQGALIGLALAITFGTARGAGSRLRYGIAAGALALMPAAFLVTFAVCLPGGSAAAPRWIVPGALRSLQGAGMAFAPAASSGAWALWAPPLWAAGVLAMWIRTAGGWWAAARISRRARPASREWQERLKMLARRMGLAVPVELRESFALTVPVVSGWLRPVVLAPAGVFAGLSTQQVECILAHELAHVLRRDYLVNILQSLVERLLFYHPAVWWVSRRVRAERENCCDDLAVAHSAGAREFAAALAALEESRGRVPEPMLAAQGGRLAQRIRRLLGIEAPPARMPAPAIAAVLLALVAAASLTAWQSARPESKRQDESREARIAKLLQTPYGKWLDEDVVYIIEERERKAYLRLRDDAERERFIEQFWARRDPTPGTPRNEFKEEHYRRIAYANQRFTASVPGWRSDKGHVYIVAGPPDEIESHPAKTGGQPSTEAWRYRWLEGIGRNVDFQFVDKDNMGDYRLINPNWKVLEPGQPPPRRHAP